MVPSKPQVGKSKKRMKDIHYVFNMQYSFLKNFQKKRKRKVSVKA